MHDQFIELKTSLCFAYYRQVYDRLVSETYINKCMTNSEN